MCTRSFLVHFFILDGEKVMYNIISQKITEKFVRLGIIKNDDYKIYNYGFELILSLVFTIFVILLLSLLTKNFFDTILFLIGFFVVRIICGGYHAKHHYSCFITSISMYIVFLLLLSLINQCSYLNLILTLMSIISIIFILAFAPVEHPHNPMTKYRKTKNRSLSFLLSFIVIPSLILLGFIKEILFYLLPLILGIFFAAVAILAAKVETKLLKRKEVNQ